MCGKRNKKTEEGKYAVSQSMSFYVDVLYMMVETTLGTVS